MTESSESPPLRASDAEREEYARIVRDAVGEGRLTLGEGDERLAAIYAVKFRGDLDPLIADLPTNSPHSKGPRGVGEEGHSREGRFREDHPFARGSFERHPFERRGEASPRRGLRCHAKFVAFAAIVLIGIWALTASQFFWPAIPLVFLTIGLLRHARAR